MLGRTLPKQLIPSVYSALINSHLSYCISVWGGNPAHLESLFNAQKKSLRSIFRVKRSRKVYWVWEYGHTKCYFNENKFLTVHNIYTYTTIIEVFKILKTCVPSSIYNELFSISNLNDLRLNTPNGRLDAYSKNFYYMAPKLWNITVNSNIIKDFSLFSIKYMKKHLKQFLLTMQNKFDAGSWHDYNLDYIKYINYNKNN